MSQDPIHADPAAPDTRANPEPDGRLVRLVAGLLPGLAGAWLYGWRGVVGALAVMAGAALGTLFWRRIGCRGPAMSLPQALGLAGLLALLLPPHLLCSGGDTWALAPAAGLLLAMGLWWLGGRGLRPVHPLLLTYLILMGLFPDQLRPRLVLHPAAAPGGDLAHAVTASPPGDEPWIAQRHQKPPAPAWRWDHTAAEHLSAYTRGRPLVPEAFSIDALLRSAMPPLEDLVIGGHPGGLGTSSAIAVLAAGLLLLYRRAAPIRVPLLLLVAAYAALLVLPVPAAITADGPVWRPLAAPRARAELATVITFANYEVFASPLLLTACLLATLPGICPSAPRAQTICALLAGFAAAAAQLYVSVAAGPILALALVGLVVPTLDEVHAPRHRR
jgi:Na+-translocating ferredoxin:NAD+ oxidoreductase RnfD subunit